MVIIGHISVKVFRKCSEVFAMAYIFKTPSNTFTVITPDDF